MGRLNIYTVLSGTPENWTVLKMDRDFEREDTYYVSKHVSVCSCFAGSRSTCRHRQLVDIFSAESKIDSREYYDYDRRKWVQRPKAAMEIIP